ncbi:hypothetical protein CP061683_1322B, partial [Chlamydia psittaci 06-1683]
AYGINISSS